MILQALLSIAIVAVIAGAILTSALVNAKIAAHQTATRLATAALSRGTDEFVNWAQRYVAKHGAATTWPTTPIVDQPVACALKNSSCALVTSYSVRSSILNSSIGTDRANNLQAALFENRLSGIVSSSLTGPNGIVLGTSSRLVILRVFSVPPFVVLTGSRDISTDAGRQDGAEGDTGGYHQLTSYGAAETPNPVLPSEAKDTTIAVLLTCSNSRENSNQTVAQSDDNSPGNDSEPWGVSGGRAFETPCEPKYIFSTLPSPPPDANRTVGNAYNVGSYHSSDWNVSSANIFNWAP
jgi:type II secretory pathway pseudopilin PulG